MGSASWSASDWAHTSSLRSTKRTEEIFTSHGMKPELDPKGVALRESRDSAINPASTAIIIGLDVTGSMGMIADTMARKGLGTLVEEILARKPVTDPHVMMCGIGDATCDAAPLQITQFEADMKIDEQLQKIWLEKRGGGNSSESYHLPWYFAALHTSIDCFEKRGKKGYLFTIGDEETPEDLTADQILRVLGDNVQRDYSARDLLTMASRMYHVFHIIVEEGQHARMNRDRVMNCWSDLLGQRAIPLADHTKLAEVVVSAIEVTEGRDRDVVAKSWSGDTAVVVARAINTLPADNAAAGGVVRFA